MAETGRLPLRKRARFRRAGRPRTAPHPADRLRRWLRHRLGGGGDGDPSSLAVNGDDLFYCVNAGVWRVKKTGRTPQRLGDVIGGCGAGMFVDERDVWVVSAQAPSTIVRVAKTRDSRR